MKSTSIFTYLSVILVLCLLGIYGLITLHASNIADIMKENINVIIEIEDQHVKNELIETLKQFPQVKKESIRFIPKEKALSIMNVKLESDFLLEDSENPFADIILLNVLYDFIEESKMKRLCEEIESMKGVTSASFQSDTYTYLESNVRRVSRLLLIVGFIISIFAFALIYSTIQLSLYAERFKIRTMELVGAPWYYIRRPFILKAFRIAFWSSLVSIGIIVILLLLLHLQFEHFGSVINIFYVLVIFLLMTLVSVLITQLASYFVVNKYLGAEKSRFYS